jgi:glycosyltransferase involved in cell wall biosynthesis
MNTPIKNHIEPHKLSALLITRNEEKHIDEVIPNISFADEIIVVDSFSTDSTVEKLSKYSNVKVIQRNFENFADQRNFAISEASYDWILFIDADERITDSLRNEIIRKLKQNSDVVAYKFRRIFIFQNKKIKFSGLQTDYIYRLFRKDSASYRKDLIVHEILSVKGKSETLRNELWHYTFSDYDSYKEKAKHYAELKALELFNKGKKPNAFDFYIKPAYKFLYNYFFRLGILDGKPGFFICKLNAYGVSHRYRKLNQLILSSKE